MARVVYGQSGYVGCSMSARAQEAYERGEMPKASGLKPRCSMQLLALFGLMICWTMIIWTYLSDSRRTSCSISFSSGRAGTTRASLPTLPTFTMWTKRRYLIFWKVNKRFWRSLKRWALFFYMFICGEIMEFVDHTFTT